MAGAPRSLELLLSCQVCFEDFEEDGDHVPRLLPCTHTLCHTCIGQLIQEGTIECPECREKHEAKVKEKSFPMNKYILTQINRKSSQEQSTAYEFQKCEEHGKELNLFCKEPECGKSICRLCHHKRHDVVDIEEQEKEVLIDDLVRIDMNLETKVEMMSQAKMNIGKKTQSFIEEIKRKREEFDSHFPKIIKEAEGLNKVHKLLIDDEVSAMNSNLELLRSLRQNIDIEGEISHEEIMNNQKRVRGIIENVNANLSGKRSFAYPIASLDECSVDEFLGNFIRDEITVSLPDLQKQIEGQLSPTAIKDATELKCTVMETIYTGINFIYSITLLSGNTAVICGSDALVRKLNSYNLHTGVELNGLNLKNAWGVTEVKLGEKMVLSVAHRDEQRIDFRDVTDFKKILHAHSVAPRTPTILDKIASSTLLYVDGSKKPFEVYQLDLSESNSKSAAEKPIIHTQQSEIYDMCFVQDGDKHLLVVATGDAGLFAYNTKTDKLEWEVNQKLTGMKQVPCATGVTTDGRGHLFVGDRGNGCIQMFSASDGQYLGHLMKGAETISDPGRIYWSVETSSLVAACSL